MEKKIYKCPRCGEEFKQKSQLIQHINKIKQCMPINENTNFNKKELIEIINNRYKKDLKEGYICPFCMLNFDEVKLNKHIFKTKENLIYHLQHKHNTTINIDEIKKYDEKDTEIIKLKAEIIQQTELIRKFKQSMDEMHIINRKLEDIKKATLYDFIIKENINAMDLNNNEIEELFLKKINLINPNKKFIQGKINEKYNKFNNIETIEKIDELNKNTEEMETFLKDKPKTDIVKPLKVIRKLYKPNYDDIYNNGIFKTILKDIIKIDLTQPPTKFFKNCFFKFLELPKYKHIFKMKRGHLMIYNNNNNYEYIIYRYDRYDRDENPEYYTEENEISALEQLIADFLVDDLYIYIEENNLFHLFKDQNISKAWINLYFNGEEPTKENYDIDIYKINTNLIYDDLTEYFKNLK